MEEKDIKIGLVGLGTVGFGVAKVLSSNSDIIAKRVTPISIKRIVDKNVGLAKEKAAEIGYDPAIVTGDFNDILQDEEISIVVELIGGIHPAYEFIKAALLAGKNVVTANKDLMASQGGELLHIAGEKGLDLLFEASVAGGIPILHSLKECLAANRIHKIMGIINGTTNYILTQMSQTGADFATCLAEAKKLGYAEADPTNDIEGFDAARKIAILASIAFNSRVVDTDVFVEGISNLQEIDIKYARDLGYGIKMLGIAKEDHGQIEVRVHPALIPLSHPLASVDDAFNAVFVSGDAVGDTMFYGRGAGELPTASAVVGDVMESARNIRQQVTGRIACTCFEEKRIKHMNETVSKYYIRLSVMDDPGVLSRISKAFGDNNVSLSSVIQKGHHNKQGDPAQIVLITHTVLEENVQKALADTKALDCLYEVKALLRVEKR